LTGHRDCQKNAPIPERVFEPNPYAAGRFSEQIYDKRYKGLLPVEGKNKPGVLNPLRKKISTPAFGHGSEGALKVDDIRRRHLQMKHRNVF
jgi:hypothetical protein